MFTLILDFKAFFTASRLDPTLTPFLSPLARSAFFSFLSLAAAAAAAPFTNFLATADFPLDGFLDLSAALDSFLTPLLGLAAALGLSFLGTAFLDVFGAAGSDADFLAPGPALAASAFLFLGAASFLDFSGSLFDMVSVFPVDFLGAGPFFSVPVEGRLVPLSELLPFCWSAFLEASALALDSSFFLSAGFGAGFLSIGAGAAFLSTGFLSAGAFLSPAVFFSGAAFFSGASFLSTAGFFSATGFLSADFFSAGFLVSSNGAGAGCFLSGFFSVEAAVAGFFSLVDGFPLPEAAGFPKKFKII